MYWLSIELNVTRGPRRPGRTCCIDEREHREYEQERHGDADQRPPYPPRRSEGTQENPSGR